MSDLLPSTPHEPKRSLRLLSFNWWCFNPDHEAAFQYILHAPFDVCCLQEVPEEYRLRLQEAFPLGKPGGTARGHDVYRLYPKTGKRVEDHVMIISRLPAEHFRSRTLPGKEPPDFPTRLVNKIVCKHKFKQDSLFEHHGQKEEVSVKVIVNGEPITIVGLHLPLTTAKDRMRQFKDVVERHPKGRTIICGDLNTLDNPKQQILNYLCGGSILEAFPFLHNERKPMEKAFADAGLANPLRGRITQLDLGGAQLDHILVPKSFDILNSGVQEDRVGSDHHAVYAEIAPSTWRH